MAKNRTVSPSTQGVRPKMRKMYDGRKLQRARFRLLLMRLNVERLMLRLLIRSQNFCCQFPDNWTPPRRR